MAVPEDDLPIDVVEPDDEPFELKWFAVLMLALIGFWCLVFFGVVV